MKKEITFGGYYYTLRDALEAAKAFFIDAGAGLDLCECEDFENCTCDIDQLLNEELEAVQLKQKSKAVTRFTQLKTGETVLIETWDILLLGFEDVFRFYLIKK